MMARDCSKFDTCSAPICPLDAAWPKAAHLPGERVCFHLLASGKAGAVERFAGDPVFRACRLALPLVKAAHPTIRRAVEAAARRGFKGGNLMRKAGPGGDGEGAVT